MQTRWQKILNDVLKRTRENKPAQIKVDYKTTMTFVTANMFASNPIHPVNYFFMTEKDLFNVS
jgi:hypothetical protein